MNSRSCLTVVLAAGAGTRMKSELPKVLHKVGGLPMIGHVFNTVCNAGTDKLAVVIGSEMDLLNDRIRDMAPEAEIFVQSSPKGTADAVKAARSAFSIDIDDVLIVYGDTPLVDSDSILEIRKALEDGTDVAVLGFEAENPHGYGRILLDGDQITAIREEVDASEEEKLVTLCNSGIMGIRRECVEFLLDGIGNSNSKGEFYLTDLVEIGWRNGKSINVRNATEDEVQGINDREQLAKCESIFQNRMRKRMLMNGVTMLDPQTVYFSHDTRIEPDVLVEENVVFGENVEIGSGAVIRAFSHIEGALVSKDSVVGPFARLRPGSKLGQGAKIGNFVEIKNAEIENGAKVNHLSYVGDAHVGENSNIGAGTITCNYDGVDKFKTEIGPDSFVGSNSSLVAPVKVGKGAYVASGSVITKDVPDGSLGVGRARQNNIKDWVKRFWKGKKK